MVRLQDDTVQCCVSVRILQTDVSFELVEQCNHRLDMAVLSSQMQRCRLTVVTEACYLHIDVACIPCTKYLTEQCTLHGKTDCQMK